MAAVPIERQLNPFPWYAQMRASAPVYYDAQRGGWGIFGYHDVQQVLSDYVRFSSHFSGPSRDSTSQPFAASLISTDPPRHRQLRALVTQAFTPKAVEALAPRISTIVNQLLDRATPGGQMDVIADFAGPLPVIVIAEMLGIPVQDRERFKRWSDAVVSTGSSQGRGYDGNAAGEMAAYFGQMIEMRRRQPGEDLISGLLAAEINGEHLSLPELMGFGSLLLVAGNETTTNLLGNALWTFSENPEVWERLRSEPRLVPSTIEEVLRYRSPVQSMFRTATGATTLGGQAIPAGSWLVAWIGSANHDESVFPNAEQFDAERTPNRHLAFGQGIHYCLGAPLAHLEARLGLEAMLARFKRIERLPGVQLERLPSSIVFGLRDLPIKFVPS